jgi:hypothetical protein
MFREDASVALESADALEASGMRLYTMIGAQLRFFYYAIRGALAKAMSHRKQLEAHAAYAGSAWQVETWEACARRSRASTVMRTAGGACIRAGVTIHLRHSFWRPL